MKERLRELIEVLGFNQVEFANSIGLTQATISRYLSGEREINTTTILAIKAVYKVNPNWLLTGEGELFVDDLSPNPFPTREGEGEWQ